MDEVLAVGDYSFQQKCLSKMGEIGQAGRTVLLVSHNLHSIVNLCQRAILLNAGKVVEDGQANDVTQSYLAMAMPSRTRGEVVWPDPATAPGNDEVRLHSARILSEDGELAADLDNAREIVIQMSYWCLKEGETG